MEILAVIYLAEGRLQEAESLQLQVPKVKKRILRSEHGNTLSSTIHLAMQATEIPKTNVGEDHPDTLRGIGHLAGTY
ncbi:nephrocystin-3 [Penicillium canescens]|nr:nephrocystin-3 [Penicillium canescens]